MSPSIELAWEKDEVPASELRFARQGEEIFKTFFVRYCRVEQWQPAVNLYETTDEFLLCADLAGMRRDQINVQLEGPILTISGYRDTPLPDAEASLHLMEIDHGRFCRQVEIPANVDIDRIQAYYRQGYLWVRLPKRNG